MNNYNQLRNPFTQLTREARFEITIGTNVGIEKTEITEITVGTNERMKLQLLNEL